jgi:hypothetical protein
LRIVRIGFAGRLHIASKSRDDEGQAESDGGAELLKGVHSFSPDEAT